MPQSSFKDQDCACKTQTIFRDVFVTIPTSLKVSQTACWRGDAKNAILNMSAFPKLVLDAIQTHYMKYLHGHSALPASVLILPFLKTGASVLPEGTRTTTADWNGWWEGGGQLAKVVIVSTHTELTSTDSNRSPRAFLFHGAVGRYTAGPLKRALLNIIGFLICWIGSVGSGVPQHVSMALRWPSHCLRWPPRGFRDLTQIAAQNL